MVRFSADADALRSTATQLDAVRDDAGSFTETCTNDVGHPGLAEALSEAAARAVDGWASAVADIEEMATRLRSSANVYEVADNDFAPHGDGAPR